MAQTLSVEVSTSDIISKIIESEAGPALSLGLSFKLPITELLQTLALMNASPKPGPQNQHAKAKAEAAPPPAPQPPQQPGLVPPGPQVIPPGPPATAPPATAASLAPTLAEEKDVPPSTSNAGTPQPTEPTSAVTWSTPLDKLQPNREEYTQKARWEPSENKWELLEKVDLSIVQIRRFERKPLVKKAPSVDSPQTAKKAEEAFAAMRNSQAGPSDTAEARKTEDFPPLPSALPPSIPPPPAPGSSKEPYEAKAGNGAADAPDVTGAETQGARPDVPPVPSGPPPAPPPGPPGSSPTYSQKTPPKAGQGGEGQGKECKQQ